MKKSIKNYLYPLQQPIPLQLLLKLTNRRVLLPFYHTISDKPLAHISNLYRLRDVALFKRDLDFYCKHFQPVSLDELYAHISETKRFTKPVFHLSFDDGLRELYTLIAPILEERGIPASIFLNSGFVDNKALFYRYKVSLVIDEIKSRDAGEVIKLLKPVAGTGANSLSEIKQNLLQLRYSDQNLIDEIAKILQIDFNAFLEKEKPYLSTAEILELQSRGFTFGAHSKDHPFFRDLSINVQKKQVSEDFTFLQQKFGITDKYFSFPFSDEGVKTEFFNYLYREENCKLSFGISGLKDDISKFHLHRIPIEGSLVPASTLIKSEYSYFMMKKPFNKNKIIRS